LLITRKLIAVVVSYRIVSYRVVTQRCVVCVLFKLTSPKPLFTPSLGCLKPSADERKPLGLAYRCRRPDIIAIGTGGGTAAVPAVIGGDARGGEGHVLWEERRAWRSSPVESLGHYAGQQQHRGTRCQMLL